MADGFTQRNQRADPSEEKLKQEIISNFNEYDQIREEAEEIVGAEALKFDTSDDNSMTFLRTKAETIMKQKISRLSFTGGRPQRRSSHQFFVEGDSSPLVDLRKKLGGVSAAPRRNSLYV